MQFPIDSLHVAEAARQAFGRIDALINNARLGRHAIRGDVLPASKRGSGMG